MCLAISVAPEGDRRTLPVTADVDNCVIDICMHYAVSELQNYIPNSYVLGLCVFSFKFLVFIGSTEDDAKAY